MKAMVWTAYGGPEVFQLQEISMPSPKENEILIRIHATTVTKGDCEIRSSTLPAFIWLPMRLYTGIRKPRIKVLGQELAGEIEAVGTAVTRFKPGDAVYGVTGMEFGTYKAYSCVPETLNEGVIMLKPEAFSYEEAAALPHGGLTALDFLRKARIQAGEKILINGAGGTIGSFAVQLAVYFGAEVTAVDSAEKAEMLRSIGASHVMDYRKADFTKMDKAYDIVFDVVGNLSFSRCLAMIGENGRYLTSNPRLMIILRGIWISKTSSKRVISIANSEKPDDLSFLSGLVESGKLKVLIDKSYPLEDLVAAHRYVETGQKKGNVVITID